MDEIQVAFFGTEDLHGDNGGDSGGSDPDIDAVTYFLVPLLQLHLGSNIKGTIMCMRNCIHTIQGCLVVELLLSMLVLLLTAYSSSKTQPQSSIRLSLSSGYHLSVLPFPIYLG
ncbi:hypothetical protein V8C86DRAFT_2440633 [Haematococcus lacustris]